MAEGDIPLGTLRWPVTIAQRVQTPDSGTSITETILIGQQVHADIQPIGALTFWGSMQVDTPVTHRIRMRYQNYLDNTYVIQRTTAVPDGGFRTETFRIRRIKEIGGRKRFVEIEAELEKAQ